MNKILIFLAFSLSSCSHKIIAKNCDPTMNTDSEYWICDKVYFK